VRFGPVPVAEAVGAVAAHTVRAGDAVVRKGSRIAAEDAARLHAAGVPSIVAVRLEPGDVGEDDAAFRLATALAGPHARVDPPFTGRANLFAEAAGVLVVDAAAIDAVNAVDEAITAATLPNHKPVVAGEMIGTVKIIPYAVPDARLAAAAAAAGQGLRVAPYGLTRVAAVSTLLPGLKPSVVAKTVEVLGRRLAPTGAAVVADVRVPHEAEALARELPRVAEAADLVVVFGASAIADRRDVIPAALEAAGGRIAHFGMPVDPGNLLLVGSLAGKPVLGAPGCARSPKENGFDWVLHRLLAGTPVGREDIVRMGVGGLLMEIVSRPQPRDERHRGAGRVAALVLAAGQSRRMGGSNKLLARIDNVPLVRRTVEAALASRAGPVLVVTGHQAEAVREALAGLDLRFVHNPDYAAGLSTSLRAGIRALPDEAQGALVCLGDMPAVTSAVLDRILAAFEPGEARIVVPTNAGKRGNPVLWSRHFFDALAGIEGDVGARHLIGAHAEAVVEVEIGPAVALDLDTPEAMAAAGGELA
jgi:molybdenum cofactor cytidylyltransferase